MQMRHQYTSCYCWLGWLFLCCSRGFSGTFAFIAHHPHQQQNQAIISTRSSPVGATTRRTPVYQQQQSSSSTKSRRHQRPGGVCLHLAAQVETETEVDNNEQQKNGQPQPQAQQQPQAQELEETPLTDADARVLQSMLSSDSTKLDLETESGVRKLLERGSVKTVKQQPSSTDKNDDDSEYASEVVKKLTDTLLWKKLSAKANDAFESISLLITNKIEQDVKILAALGLFAWDRVVKDVARALPEAGSTARKVLLITNTSSYDEMQQTIISDETTARSAVEELNRPADEIKSVTRALWDILSGERTRDVGRGLRTAAPAGTSQYKQRAQRAYKQTTRVRQQQRDVTKMAGKVVDTAVEFKRELRAERNVPGYKSEGVRKAIGAGVTSTKNLLETVKEGARLAAAKRKQLRLQQAIAEEPASQLIQELNVEAKRIAQRLRYCIVQPEDTWLRPDVLLDATSGRATSFDESALRDVVTSMILVRDLIDAIVVAYDDDEIGNDNDENENETKLEALVTELMDVKNSIDGLRSRAAESISYAVAEELWNDIMYTTTNEDEDDESSSEGNESTSTVQQQQQQPLILRLEDVLESRNMDVSSLLEEDPIIMDGDVEEAAAAAAASNDDDAWFATASTSSDGDDTSSTAATTVVTPEILDVDTEFVSIDNVSSSTYNAGATNTATTWEDDDYTTVSSSSSSSSSTGLMAEVVSDDDFDEAFGAAYSTARVTTAVDDDEDDSEQENEHVNSLARISLRTLDVAFFVLEKTFTVAVPNTLVVGETVTKRYAEVNQGGKGKKGWSRVSSSADPKGRY